MIPPSDYVTKVDLNVALAATKADLNAALAATKADLNAALAATKADLKAALAATKADLKADFKADLKATSDELYTKINTNMYRYMVPREEFEELRKKTEEFQNLSLNSFDRIFSILEDLRADNVAHLACYSRLEADVATNTRDIAFLKTKLIGS